MAGGSGINATPTVFVDGQQWIPQTTNDFSAFVKTVLDAKK